MNKDVRGSLPRLAARLRPEWSRLAFVAVFSVISVGFLVTGPRILGDATNIVFDGFVGKHLPAGVTTKAQAVAVLRARGQGHLADMLRAMNVTPGAGVDLTRLGRVLGLAALVYLLSAAFSWAQAYIMAGIAQRTVYGLRQAVEEKLARLPLRYFDRHSHGDILSRLTNDIDNLTTTLEEGLGQLLISALTVIGVLGMMFWVSPLLAVVSLVTIPLTIVVTLVLARRSKTRFAAQWNRTGRLNGLVEETHTGHALVLAFGQRRPTMGEFGRQNEQLYEASFRAQFLSGVILPAVQFVGNLNYVVIAALGGFQVATGVISLGDVQAFIQYSRRFTVPITAITSLITMVQSGLASADRVFEFLDAPEEAATPAKTAGSWVGGAGSANAGPALAGQARPPSSTCSCASTKSIAGGFSWTASTTETSAVTRYAAASAWCCKIPGCSLARSGTTSLTERKAQVMRRSSPRPAPPTSITSSALCPTAMPLLSTGTRPTSPPAKSSC